MENDPLEILFVSPDWTKGYKAGREYERSLAEAVLKSLGRAARKSEMKWRGDLRKLAQLQKPKSGKFGLKTGKILLNRVFEKREEAEAFADYNSKGRGVYSVVEL